MADSSVIEYVKKQRQQRIDDAKKLLAEKAEYLRQQAEKMEEYAKQLGMVREVNVFHVTDADRFSWAINEVNNTINNLFPNTRMLNALCNLKTSVTLTVEQEARVMEE